MSWDDIKENDSDFTKIEAGKDVRVHILGGEPQKQVMHFIAKGQPPKECVHPCDTCASGNKPRVSFKIAVYNLGAKKEQTLEQGIMVFKQIKKIKEVYAGDLSKVDMIISREGAGQNDTKYTVIAVPTKFTPDMIKKEEVPF